MWFSTCSVISPLPIRDFVSPLLLSTNQRPVAVCVTLLHSMKIQPTSHTIIPLTLQTTHTHTASDGVSSAADVLFVVLVCHISIFKVTLHKTVIFLNEQHVICVDYKKVWLSPDCRPLMVMDRLKHVSSD